MAQGHSGAHLEYFEAVEIRKRAELADLPFKIYHSQTVTGQHNLRYHS